MSDKSQRNIGLDVIRCVALFSVVAVHFFLNAGFYDEIVEGPIMMLFVFIRSGLMVSIPLFLMLSGYLLHDKKASARYYLRIFRILFIYVCVSVLFGLFRVYIAKDGYTLRKIFWDAFGFHTLSYSWYIEMYCGLFLLIPFLNVLYHGLEAKKQKQSLIITLLILTTLPSMVNIYRFDSLHWWLLPASNNVYQPLIPGWWTSVYPLTYYFIGCYLREFPLKIKGRYQLLIMLALIPASGLFNYYRSYGEEFVAGPWQDWGSSFCVGISVLLFSYLESRDYQKIGNVSGKIIRRISELSLGAYLLSELFDYWFYTILNGKIPEVQARFPYMPLAISVILPLSLAGSWVVDVLYRHSVAKLVSFWKKKLTA